MKMGRPTVLTDEQRDEKKAKWFAARDVRRRHRYADDPDYRDARREASREDFRKRQGMDMSALRDSRKNLDKLDDFGKPREIVVAGEAEVFLTFTINELAKVLGDYNPTIIRRWISNDKLPAPILSVNEATGSFGREGGTSDVQVYTEPEVAAIIEVLGSHQAKFANYRSDHTDTTRLLYDAVEIIRNELGLA
jgi:hypothetical protein